MKFADLNLLAVGNTIQMAGAIFSGEGHTYLCFFPGENNSLSIEALDMSLDDWQKFLRQTDLLETEVFARSSDGALAKTILRKSQRQIDQHVSWRVFERDAYACRYCGRDDMPLTVDHLVRWEEGGPSIEDNLVSACRHCNKDRGDMSYETWIRSDRYARRSQNLTDAERAVNQALLWKLDKIPRQLHVRSR